jgi:hypothetical protein
MSGQVFVFKAFRAEVFIEQGTYDADDARLMGMTGTLLAEGFAVPLAQVEPAGEVAEELEFSAQAAAEVPAGGGKRK